MKKPEESDLVRLVKELERKRQERAKAQESAQKLADDAKKVQEYYESEMNRLRVKGMVIHREVRVLDVQIEVAKELVQEAGDLHGWPKGQLGQGTNG